MNKEEYLLHIGQDARRAFELRRDVFNARARRCRLLLLHCCAVLHIDVLGLLAVCALEPVHLLALCLGLAFWCFGGKEVIVIVLRSMSDETSFSSAMYDTHKGVLVEAGQ